MTAMQKRQDAGRAPKSGNGSVGRREVLKASAAALGAVVIPADVGMAHAEGPPEARPRPAAAWPRPGGKTPFPALFEKTEWDRRGKWSASWVGCADAEQAPVVAAYRLRFDTPTATTVRLRVSADERYDLFLDGRRIGRGSERGNLEHWFYESFEVALAAGAHVLVARVFSLGPLAPLAQFQVRPAFLLAAEGDAAKRLETGTAPWEAQRLPGYSFEPPVYVWGLAAPVTVDAAAFAWGFERGEGEGWRPVLVHERASSALADYGIAPSRYLQAGTLPAMIDRPWTRGRVRHVSAPPSLDTLPIPVRATDHLEHETAAWQELVLGRAPLVVPANTLRRVIVDLENYVCAYPELVTSGGTGSLVRLQFAEALREANDKWNFAKGNRDTIEGRYFLGMGDSFRPDGGERRFDTLWFAAGRYLEVVVRTDAEPLVLKSLGSRETRYPLELESRFTAADPELDALQPILVRGMQMCAHETYFDCPYFEQMQYVADARVEALVQYVMTRDDRLPRKALYLIDASRHASGLTESRYPVREPQFIPWFSLVWIGAVHDYACWRDDAGFVRALLPGVRGVIEAFLARRDSDGLVRTPEGWNDSEGTKEREKSGLTHWMLVWTLRLAAELEDGFGEPEPAGRFRRLANELAGSSDQAFWNERTGLYSDSPGGGECSELVQCLALLCGGLPPPRRERVSETLLRGGAADPVTVHTTHYLFEVCRLLGRPQVVFDRLAFWVELGRQGLRTPVESAEPTRSDCHAWGSHPLFHFFATLLGIRPAGWGFREVEIAPLLGPLEHASGRLVHPSGGEIVVELEQKGGALHGRVVLPPTVTGTLRLAAGRRPLPAGETRF
jgi:alpha-L-rhamnosidase